ncbi:MAG: EamA family transporter [Leptolyngbya sp. SIO1E4]|nr:EamA family transporter [Leptolyngbya sp. SIO1E4]
MAHIYIFLTIILTVYGQLIIKWQVNSAGALPVALVERVEFLSRLLFNPWVISSFLCAFMAALSWMIAMTKFPLSYAYPFTSLAFVLVFFLSVLLFRETVTLPKLIGTGLVVAGIIIGSRV